MSPTGPAPAAKRIRWLQEAHAAPAFEGYPAQTVMISVESIEIAPLPLTTVRTQDRSGKAIRAGRSRLLTVRLRTVQPTLAARRMRCNAGPSWEDCAGSPPDR